MPVVPPNPPIPNAAQDAITHAVRDTPRDAVQDDSARDAVEKAARGAAKAVVRDAVQDDPARSVVEAVQDTTPAASRNAAREVPETRELPKGPGPGGLIRYACLAHGRGRPLAVAVAGLAGHQVAEALVPVLIGVIVDRAVGGADVAALAGWLGALAAVFAGLILCWRVATRLNTRVYVYGEHELRLLAARRILHPRGMAVTRAPGEILTISTSDASNVSGFSWVVSEQGACVAALVTAVTALALISWPLALGVLAATAAQLALVHRLSRPLDERVYAERRQAARAGTLATDFTVGLRVLKGYGAEAAAAARYRDASRASMRAALATADAQARLSAVNAGVAGIFLTGIALAASWLALNGTITVGGLVSVVGLAQFVRSPMEQLGFLGAELAAKRGSARRLAELLATPYATPEVGHVGLAEAEQGPVLSVRVGGETIEARRGELLGIDAGDAAAELLDVLAYRIPVEPGRYLLGGADAVRLGPERVRERVFAPPREASVFTGTVADNLAREGSDPAALAASGLDEVLTHLPHGLRSEVGEQGHLLSGGQRQRLLLARALHQPQPVVVLHEPTTSVDSVTEQRVGQALRGFPDRTIILITRSPGLLHACDRVLRPALAGEGR
ncbi:ABC transporter transmembrane domain-containing protein [Streptosporangium saharense]|uniref:ABC transporter transmembrane domain-containing protein n=1 Tax=Streptosporangium saharense TaxID=1706840 RepID=UPI00367BDFC0